MRYIMAVFEWLRNRAISSIVLAMLSNRRADQRRCLPLTRSRGTRQAVPGRGAVYLAWAFSEPAVMRPPTFFTPVARSRHWRASRPRPRGSFRC
jgi:hypothetical protein